MNEGCIIVTGASRGIGAAIAEALARDGFTVGCLSRSRDLPARDIADAAVRARFIAAACDVTERDSVKAAVEEVVRQSPAPLVGLVNNAGLHREGPSDSLPIAEFEQVMTANATSVESLSSGPLSRYLAKRIPTGAPGAAEDVAQLVRLLFTLTGRFMTGETLYLDGGQGMAL